MKRLITSIIFLLVCATAFAQFEWLGVGEPDIKRYDHTLDKGHLLIFENYFLMVDSNATVKFRFEEYDTDGYSYDFIEVFEMPDASRIVFYWGLFPMNLWDFGTRYNKDWYDIFIIADVGCLEPCNKNTLSLPYDETSFVKCQLAEEGHGYIARMSALEDDVFWYAAHDSTDTYFYGLAVLGGNIHVCSDRGLLVFDGDGGMVAQHPQGIYSGIHTLGDTSLVAVSGDTLFRFTPDFVPLDTAIVTDGHVRHWDASSGRVGVLTTTNRYVILDGQLNVTASVPLDTAFFEFERTQVGGGSAFLAGGFTYGPAVWPTSGTFVKEYGLDGQDLAPRKDIGVTNLANLQDAVVFHQGGKYHVEYDSLVVTVENFGDTAIHRLALRAGHYDQGDPTNPDTFRRGPSKGYSNVSPPLQPGESRAFVWKDARISFATDPAGHLLDLCVLTAQPNGGIDVDASNDLGCSGYVVGTDGVASIALQATVHPSPASGQVTVSLPVPLSHPAAWRLYDQLGREAMRTTLVAGQQVAAVSVGDLPPGLYFWGMASEGRQVGNGKLVVLKD